MRIRCKKNWLVRIWLLNKKIEICTFYNLIIYNYQSDSAKSLNKISSFSLKVTKLMTRIPQKNCYQIMHMKKKTLKRVKQGYILCISIIRQISFVGRGENFWFYNPKRCIFNRNIRLEKLFKTNKIISIYNRHL